MKKFIIAGEVTLPFKYILLASSDDEAENMANELTYEDIKEALIKSKAEIYVETVDEGEEEDLIVTILKELKGDK